MKAKLRIFAIAMALAVLLLPVAALGGEYYAFSPASRMIIYVSATLPTGETATYGPAVPVTDSLDENRLWLKVPLDVFFTGTVTLQLDDILSEYTRYDPENGSVLENIRDAGASLDSPTVMINTYDEIGSGLATFYLYISSQDVPTGEAPVEQPTAEPRPTNVPGPVPTEVTVRYLNELGEPIAPDTVAPVQPGSNTIYPEAVIPDDYTLISFGAQEVNVDAGGINPPVVEFYYAAKKVSVPVTIHYVDVNGAPIAEDTVFNYDAGEHPVHALPVEGYTVLEPSFQTVYVDKNGANPEEITFWYEVTVEPASVTVHYLDENGAPLRNDDVLTYNKGMNNVIAIAIPGYTLTGSDAQPVLVDENGAQPNEITFVYQRDILPVEVAVRYVDENDEPLAPDTTQTVTPAANIVTPAGGVSLEEYQLTSPEAVEVDVTADGASPEEVTFRYKRIIKPASVVLHYVDDLGNPIAEDSVVSVPGGDSVVTPAAFIDPAAYSLMEPSSYPVTVTLEGASANEFTFAYQRLVQPVAVTVHYIDGQGNAIAPDTQAVFGEGAHEVKPAAEISAQDYILNEPVSYPVTVTLEGASAYEFTFVYSRVVKPALVTVHYVNEAGEPVAEDSVQTLNAGANVVIALDIPGYTLMEDIKSLQNVTVDADGAHPGEVTFKYKARVIEPVSIPVLFVDQETGYEIASRRAVTVNPGTAVEILAEPAPEDLLPDYVLASEPVISVNVDKNGVSSVKEAVFRYAYAPQPTDTTEPAPTETVDQEPNRGSTEEPVRASTEEPEPTQEPAQPVTLTVRYIDTEGKPVATEGRVRCNVGDTAVSASPADLLPGYVPEGPQDVLVHVDENGADPAEIIFLYRYSDEAPAPKVALVNVKYVGPEENVFYSYPITCAEGQENPVSINWDFVDPSLGYTLSSKDTVYVTVDGSGNAEPTEVAFKFKYELSEDITIKYLDQVTRQAVAEPSLKTCYVGANTVEADPVNLQSGYTLSGPDTVTVIMGEDGALTPSEVEFLYWKQATEEPAVTAAPYEEPMNIPFHPTGPTINVRSTPSLNDNNVIGVVSSSDLGYIKAKISTADGKTWYAVEINGLVGYMSESVARPLSEAEMAVLNSVTPAPTAVPTPIPTEVPDGAVIDRWAVTNAKVNFRRTPDTSNSRNRIEELHKNVRVWVYASENVDGAKWYSINYKGISGYVRGEFLDLLSEVESEQVQLSLASPMPTQTPPATPEPTPAPTPEPTPEPTEAPTEAPTPEPTQEPTEAPTEAPTQEPTDTPEPPYQGYAVTVDQKALRTGVSLTDDTILQILPPQTLLDVKSVTTVDGVPWACAQAVGSENWGYIPMADLKKITNDEAKAYQNQIFATPTVTPTITPEQVEGYAMTLGDGVPMRNYPDVNGEIIMLLPYTAVARVFTQQYTDAAWHVVQYNGMWGFIRQDQLRMMSADEVAAYEESMLGGTPSPSPAPTPEPITENSPSSYGHVLSNSGKVNLRSGPSTQSTALRLLDNYAFALVLGVETNDEGTWYHVSQAGTEGYIRSDYFKVLSLAELTQFLKSDDYLNAVNNNANGTASVEQIQSVEDYNRTVWQNPALSASYEPFNPFATSTPAPEIVAPTNTPAPTETPAPSTTPQIAPVGPSGNLPEPNVQQGGAPWPWILLGLAVVGGGGAYYAYTVNAQNKKRAALRAQQARQARGQAAAHPQMRAAPNNPEQAAGIPAQNVNRSAYPSKRKDLAYLPPKQNTQKDDPAAAFKPLTTQPRQQTASGETKTFPLSRTQGQTQVYQPVRPAAKETQNLGDTAQWKPKPAPVKEEQTPAAPKTPEVPAPTQATASTDAAATPHRRIRRTERNKDLYDKIDQG